VPTAGQIRAIPRAVGRFGDVEQTVAALQQRVDDLESALDALRDELRRCTEAQLIAAAADSTRPQT